MTGRSFFRCCGLAAFALMALMLDARSAKADVCDNSNIPQCYVQTDTGELKADRSEYMNVYCPAGMYAWGGWSDSWSSSWHIITRNPIGDNLNSLDFLLSNTSVHSNRWSISIACSPINPNGSCNGASKEVSDPGCPESNRQTECQPADNCWVTWNEQCVNGDTVTNYFCSQALFVTTCFSCEASSGAGKPE